MTRFPPSVMTVQLMDAELEVIRGILRAVPNVRRAALFGSRAMQNARKGSDVDLVLFGRLERNDVSQVRTELEEGTCLPYFFDVVSYDAVQSDELRKHIDECGVVVYEG
jgi:uncharacterized protein